MYGKLPLAKVLSEASKVGARAVDIWPLPHANHREQLDELGHDNVHELLDRHGVGLGVITRYDLGPYRLQPEMEIVHRLGGKLLVTGARRESGETLKQQVQAFVDRMRPHAAKAESLGLTIGIENHAGDLLATTDAVRYFADAISYPGLGLAMAPYHLPQNAGLIADLIEQLADKLVFFQAWQHGRGCREKLPKEEELLQMPGRGSLDFTSLLAALKRINYQGWAEIFMHPVPRGVPIHENVAQVTQEINRSRDYLDKCLKQVNAT